MRNKQYWKGRSLLLEQLLNDRSEATVQQISRLYGLAQENIFQQIEKIFATYVKGGALNEAKAMELLSVQETEEAERELRELYQTATGQAKRDIWARLAAPAYANRISRLQALRDKLYVQARMMGLEEVSYVRDRLSDTLEQSYYRTTFDIQQYTGEGYRFDLLTDNQIKAALAMDWNGKNWSERIWDNNQRFADAVQDTVTVGIMTGLRYDEMRDNLLHVIGLDESEGARYRSARLVKTECAYIANQGHLMGYQAAEIERYIYLATLDLRTSEVCRGLDMQRFPVSEAQVGTNLPPMHPHCRSTTMPDMTAEQLRKVPRAARDPKTGKSITVPGDMTYQQWYEKFVEGRGDAQPMARSTPRKDRLRELTLNEDREEKRGQVPEKGIAKTGKNGILKETGIGDIPVTQEAIDHVPAVKASWWDDDMTQRIQAGHKSLLEYVKDQPVGTEAAFGLSMSGTVEVQNMGEMGRVSLPGLDYDHIVIHNHPDCGPLSHKDIERFIWRDGLQGITAVGNDGSVCGLFKGPNYDGFAFLNLYRGVVPDLKKQIESGNESDYLSIIYKVLKGAESCGAEFVR